MPKFLNWLNLQLFADGGDGGTSAGEGEGSEGTGEDSNLTRIPERARENYKKAISVNKKKPSETPGDTTSAEEKPKADHVAYADLIKSDDYREEHEAYMKKAIGDRLKSYKGVEAENKTMKDALGIVANKYGIDPTSEDFITTLQQKISEDNSYYEDYAMEHNISADDAKEILTLKHQVKQQEAEQKRIEAENKQNEFISLLRAKAEGTKAIYPNFSLETELQNPMFRNLVSATNGDTTAAYRALHHDELLKQAGLQASQRATQQVAASVAANQARPIENGLSSQASTTTVTDWSKASLADIRKYAEEQRRKH